MSRLDLADGLRLIHQARGEDRFGHIQHLRFGWSLLDEAADIDDAERVALITIKDMAEMSGSPGKYHYTVTVFWIRLLDHVRRTTGASSLEEAMTAHPELSDPHLPERHWSDINDADAKRHWVEPDLLPLP